MRVEASTRPKGMKKGLRTEAFYKAIGYESECGPDVRDVVGTLTLSVTRANEIFVLAELFNFYRTDAQEKKLTITIDGKETCVVERKPEPEQQSAA